MGLVVNGLRSPLLQDCRLTVEAGEVVALRGASGSGKTALLRAIADLDPNEGEVALDDIRRDVTAGPDWRRRVRYVAAEAAWWADRVADHFRAPDAVLPLAEQVGLPADCLGWQVARLSTGEKQRLGLLRALEDDPRVLLLDEPTAALDAEAEAAVEGLIRRRQARGVAIILVTHSDAQADRLATRRYRMDHGRLAEDVR